MKSLQLWSPDTCRCKVEEEWDTESPDLPHTCTKVIAKCQAHENVPDDELYGVLYANPDGENKRKNMIHRILLDLDEVKDLGISEPKKNKDGSDAGVGFKEGIEYKWSFEGKGKDRILTVEVKGAILSVDQKKSLKDLCDKKFGINKVKI